LLTLVLNHQTTRFQFGNIFHFSCTALDAFFYNKGDIFVNGTPSSLLFNTINRDQLSETSISSSYLTSFFLFFVDLLEFVYLKDLKQPCCHV
jgi:hypothetical protein